MGRLPPTVNTSKNGTNAVIAAVHANLPPRARFFLRKFVIPTPARMDEIRISAPQISANTAEDRMLLAVAAAETSELRIS